MTELDAEARGLIQLARGAENATRADRARIRERLGAVLGLGAAGMAVHEAISSGVQASLTPLSERTPEALGQGLGMAERTSGEMLIGSTSTLPTAGFLATTPWVLQAVAALMGGALAAGTAWLVTREVDVHPRSALEAPVLAVHGPSGEERAPDSVPQKPAKALPTALSAESSSDSPALVPQPELPVMKAPIRPEDLPMLSTDAAARKSAPSRTSAAARSPSRRNIARGTETGASLADEARDLSQVHEALRGGHYALALSRLERMDRRPFAMLGEERQVARVLSLCGLGRMAEAEAVARRVRSTAPESPLLPRLAGSCVGNGNSSERSR